MQTLFGSLILFGLGGFLALAFAWSNRISHTVGVISAVAGSAVGILACILMMQAGIAQEFSMPWATAGTTLSLRVDNLALFFLLPIFLLTLCCAVYATSYLHATTRRGQYGYHWFFFNLLAASMVLVVTAADAIFFLMVWECMSLSSFFLVTYDYARDEVRRAGWLYLIATHCGTLFLFLLFLLAGWKSGSFAFASFAELKSLELPMAVLLFFLALIGFGTKAGLFPLHIWLPVAHPAAPSHVSALMSAVMIKTGIYGLLRITTFLPPLPAWCGIVVFSLGIGGALFAIAMATMQTDIKRSLAFSSVENVGIIFLGLGVSLYAASIGQPVVATLAMAGALLHIWNHSLFKGLLFLGAGSLVHGAGTREISHMGGLLRRMPVTGTLVIFGCVAISALPPLNGFVSEWLIYMGMLEMGQASTGAIAILFLSLIVFLALVGGMVLITFSRLAGMALLGEPRRETTAAARESGWPMLAAMGLLMVSCLLIGLYPALALRQVTGVAEFLLGQNVATAFAGGEQLASLGWISRVLFIVIVGLVLFRWRLARGVRRMPTWGCGFMLPNSRMAYTAGGYTELIQKSVFSSWMQPKFSNFLPKGLFPRDTRLTLESHDPVFLRIFQPLFTLIAEKANACRALQAGQLHIYFLYIFTATTLLLGLVLWPF
jgi:hydrogenase-4 component B